jgi:hypothetical protein
MAQRQTTPLSKTPKKLKARTSEIVRDEAKQINKYNLKNNSKKKPFVAEISNVKRGKRSGADNLPSTSRRQPD